MIEPAAKTSDAAVEGAKALRETTKWLVAGVAATAAGVFAGSSLTNLGSLDPLENTLRLGLAILGAAIGFTGLAIIVVFAISVLTVEAVNLDMIAQADIDPNGDRELKALAGSIAKTFKRSFPITAVSVAELATKIDALPKSDPLFAKVRTFRAAAIPYASFLRVRTRFVRLGKALIPATFLAAAGFGLFAWAANPPAPAPPAVPSRPPSVIVIPAGHPGS
jgi:hypothetical protein